jgi:hypothetical protein
MYRRNPNSPADIVANNKNESLDSGKSSSSMTVIADSISVGTGKQIDAMIININNPISVLTKLRKSSWCGNDVFEVDSVAIDVLCFFLFVTMYTKGLLSMIEISELVGEV